MVYRLGNRIAHTITTASNAQSVTMNSTPETGFQSFASAGYSNGDDCPYLIIDGDNWEVGDGKYTNSTTFDRTTVFDGSSGATRITLSGSAIVYVDCLAENLAGIETKFFGPDKMVPRVTNGAAYTVVETTTYDRMIAGFNFDTTTEEGVNIITSLPNRWDKGTITFQPWHRRPSGTNTGIVWGFRAICKSNGDSIDGSVYGTEQLSTDTLITADYSYLGPETSALTIANNPAANDLLWIEITREVGNASDNFTGDATLLGVIMRFNRTGPSDERQ